MRSFVSWYWQRSHQLWPRVLNAIGRMLLSRSGSSAGVQPILHESQLSFLRSGHTNWPREAGCFGLDFRRRFDRRSLWIGRAFAGIVQRFSRSLISIELLWCFVFERPRRATDDLLCVRGGRDAALPCHPVERRLHSPHRQFQSATASGASMQGVHGASR